MEQKDFLGLLDQRDGREDKGLPAARGTLDLLD